MSDRRMLGRWGEKRCEKYLKSKGLKTLVRNYLCKAGELDLVMVDSDGTIVFVEVKTRSSEDFTPAENVLTKPKKDSLSRSAQFFLKAHNIEDRSCRFDFAIVALEKNGKETIKHYENAFVP